MSYNFRHRVTEETVNRVFRWILEEVAEAEYLWPKAVFIDGTHIKANANTRKQVKVQIPAASRHYAKELMEEVNTDREAHGKKPFAAMTLLRLRQRSEGTIPPKRSWPGRRRKSCVGQPGAQLIRTAAYL